MKQDCCCSRLVEAQGVQHALLLSIDMIVGDRAVPGRDFVDAHMLLCQLDIQAMGGDVMTAVVAPSNAEPAVVHTLVPNVATVSIVHSITSIAAESPP